MDRRAAAPSVPSPLALHLLVFALLICPLAALARGNAVFQVLRRFTTQDAALEDFRAHDARRHGRSLAAVDLPIGGTGLTTGAGLYFTEIGIGTPPKKYYVQVDTGSDILWVNCIHCEHCPSHSDLGLELKLYDPKSSYSGRIVTCHQDFCYEAHGETERCGPEQLCPYNIVYGDGSGTDGYYVTDYIQYNELTAHQFNATITFGCGARQSGGLGSSNMGLDGILGFGQANSSMISQLAFSGKVRKKFAHCLDTVKGGGIFAVGHVLQPKVKTTPLIPYQPHYNVIMRSIDVGDESLQLPMDLFDVTESKGVVIDSGTTLAYLPEAAYKPLINAILSYQPNLSIEMTQDLLCFQYTGSVDEGFPVVTFHFENSLSLRVFPHDYLFQTKSSAVPHVLERGRCVK